MNTQEYQTKVLALYRSFPAESDKRMEIQAIVEKAAKQAAKYAKKAFSLDDKVKWQREQKEQVVFLMQLRREYFIDDENPEIRLNDEQLVGPIMAGV